MKRPVHITDVIVNVSHKLVYVIYCRQLKYTSKTPRLMLTGFETISYIRNPHFQQNKFLLYQSISHIYSLTYIV